MMLERSCILSSGSLDAKKIAVLRMYTVLVQHTCKVGCGFELHGALFVLSSMWFGVIVILKNQRGTRQSNWNENNILHSTVPNQELSCDSFCTFRLPLAVHAYASTVPVCNSLPVQ